jgi:hypothetical protein
VIKTAQELINGATDLAQMSNSNMISYARSIALLNSAYSILHNHIVEMGEDWGTKELELRPRDRLPENLMKITGIYDKKSKEEILRVDYIPGRGEYFIHGNNIDIGHKDSDRRYLMRYYERTPTVTFPSRRVKGDFVAISSNYAARLARDENMDEIFEVVDLRTRNFDVISTIPIIAPPAKKVILTGRGLVYIDSTDTLRDTSPFQMGNVQDLTHDKHGKNRYSFMQNDYWVHMGWDNGLSAGEPFSHHWGAYNLSCTYADSQWRIYNNELYDVTSKYVPDGWELLSPFHVSYPYMTLDIGRDTSYRTIVICHNGKQYDLFPRITYGQQQQAAVIDIDHNDKHGYGIIYKQEGATYIMGFAEDTIFDFPVTIYFDWIEAQLAMLFLIEARQQFQPFADLANSYWDIVTKRAERQINMAHKIKHRRGNRVYR